jgi:hypothetical protein
MLHMRVDKHSAGEYIITRVNRKDELYGGFQPYEVEWHTPAAGNPGTAVYSDHDHAFDKDFH